MSYQDLENELKQIKHDSVFAEVIREKPIQSIPMIADQIKDNRIMVCEIIGERLVAVIEEM